MNGARTVYGWDGDTLAYESADERSTHYLYEPETFVPMAHLQGNMVSDRQDGAATAAPSDKKTGENYFDESGEYLSDADTRGHVADQGHAC
nr:hypothetical protein [Burkholderia glumae]